MNRTRAMAIAERTAPLVLKLVTAANVLFLGSFLIALHGAVQITQH